jgi:hypothetical protein
MSELTTVMNRVAVRLTTQWRLERSEEGDDSRGWAVPGRKAAGTWADSREKRPAEMTFEFIKVFRFKNQRFKYY